MIGVWTINGMQIRCEVNEVQWHTYRVSGTPDLSDLAITDDEKSEVLKVMKNTACETSFLYRIADCMCHESRVCFQIEFQGVEAATPVS